MESGKRRVQSLQRHNLNLCIHRSDELDYTLISWQDSQSTRLTGQAFRLLVNLERSLGSKYPGTKRFGLEGGESLIPMMSEAIQRIGGYGAKEICIGMAHRGPDSMCWSIFWVKTRSTCLMSSRGR